MWEYLAANREKKQWDSGVDGAWASFSSFCKSRFQHLRMQALFFSQAMIYTCIQSNDLEVILQAKCVRRIDLAFALGSAKKRACFIWSQFWAYDENEESIRLEKEILQ